MSLNYDLTNIAVTPTIPFLANGDMNLTTHALIWIGMVADLDVIKESNVDEWVVRTGVLHELIKSTKFTRQDIVDNIGLSTNCDNLTRARWMARMSNIQKRLLNDMVNNAERANKKAVIS